MYSFPTVLLLIQAGGVEEEEAVLVRAEQVGEGVVEGEEQVEEEQVEEEQVGAVGEAMPEEH